jgi:hypothetical protein
MTGSATRKYSKRNGSPDIPVKYPAESGWEKITTGLSSSGVP